MATAPSCPSCATPLASHAVAQGLALGCARCGGVWLDNVASQTITRSLDHLARSTADAYAAAAAVPFPRAATGAPCPTCRVPLVEVNVAAAGIHVDVCAAHGTWFERHELHGVMDAFERARAEALAARQRAIASAPVAAPSPSWAPSTDDTEPDLATTIAVDLAFDLVAGLVGALFDQRD